MKLNVTYKNWARTPTENDFLGQLTRYASLDKAYVKFSEISQKKKPISVGILSKHLQADQLKFGIVRKGERLHFLDEVPIKANLLQACEIFEFWQLKIDIKSTRTTILNSCIGKMIK